jgi:hypothetical protein
VVDDDEDASREPEAEREEDVVSGRGVLGWLRLDGVGMGILSIAAPAVLALAADPIAALVDTAFVGHLGNKASFSRCRGRWIHLLHYLNKVLLTLGVS